MRHHSGSFSLICQVTLNDREQIVLIFLVVHLRSFFYHLDTIFVHFVFHQNISSSFLKNAHLPTNNALSQTHTFNHLHRDSLCGDRCFELSVCATCLGGRWSGSIWWLQYT